MNIGRLEYLMAKGGITKVGLAAGVGLSDQTIGNVLKGADIKVSSLKKIADYFNVPVGYFFDECSVEQNTEGSSNVVVGRDNNGNISISECQNKLEDALKEIDHLKELNSEKERLIQVLLKRQ
ncbi:helix-turn-helix domain-containing protein [Parabacteroides goldsteinii]|uniref:helix-turn-helix domain-containing protein n=1 Tax=Parabacteroides goldsteinii TaxID=328812 RepID=UPI00189EFDF6|nr:helix-turn-helix transcriptional regulator [Parabacteroides goldsteinii]